MHNKFFVLSKDGEPVAVWTGSTNISENGIFGHLNVGHSVEDTDVASAYLTYWHAACPATHTQAAQKQWIDANDVIPPPDAPWTEPITLVLSPHSDDAVLRRYDGDGRDGVASAVHDVRVRDERSLQGDLHAATTMCCASR